MKVKEEGAREGRERVEVELDRSSDGTVGCLGTPQAVQNE